MRKYLAIFVALGAAAAFAACSAGEDPQPGGPGLSTRPEGSAMPLDHPPIDVSQTPAARPRRLDVAQLEGSWAVVFGKDKAGKDITWRLPDNSAGLARYARTLGEPDYIATTDLDVEPSLLYAKFMDDAARSACDQALDADAARTNKGDRVLLRKVEWTDVALDSSAAVDENLRYLKLRFHGVRVAADDAATLKPLHDLYFASAKGDKPAREGWRTVCVALATAPEFHLY